MAGSLLSLLPSFQIFKLSTFEIIVERRIRAQKLCDLAQTHLHDRVLGMTRRSINLAVVIAEVIDK